MRRRSLFQLALCAVAASAMEVFGLVPMTAPDVPKTAVSTLWQRVHFMNSGKPHIMYCLSDRHPDKLTFDEFKQCVEDGGRMASLEVAYTNFGSVVMEHRTDNNVIWKGIIP